VTCRQSKGYPSRKANTNRTGVMQHSLTTYFYNREKDVNISNQLNRYSPSW